VGEGRLLSIVEAEEAVDMEKEARYVPVQDAKQDGKVGCSL
jgi:hypothetical protein